MKTNKGAGTAVFGMIVTLGFLMCCWLGAVYVVGLIIGIIGLLIAIAKGNEQQSK